MVKPLSAQVRQQLRRRQQQQQQQASESSESSSGLLQDYLRERELLTLSEQEERASERELHDDYAFLDEDEDLEDEDVMVRSPNGLPSWQDNNGRGKRDAGDEDAEDEDEEDVSEIQPQMHVVFRRKDTVEHSSDYRE